MKSQPQDGNEYGVALNDLLQKNVTVIRQIEESAQKNRSRTTKIADAIAAFCGSIMFVYVHMAWFVVWLTINTIPAVPKRYRFDPPPFSNLTLVVSLEAILLSTVILISQNRQQAISEQRNHLDLQINLLAEQETSEIIKLLTIITDKVGAEISDERISAMINDTDPIEVVKSLDQPPA